MKMVQILQKYGFDGSLLDGMAHAVLLLSNFCTFIILYFIVSHEQGFSFRVFFGT